APEFDRLAGADKALAPANVHGSGSRCRCRPSFENCHLAWKPSVEKIKVNPDVKYGVKRRRRNFDSGG
ncbi:hypothetical protein ACCT02_38110, partial [Rhizobium ruizarguesonis]